MHKLLLFILLFPLFIHAQYATPLNKDETAKVYSQAIAEYLKAVSKSDSLRFDTLFIGRYEDLHEIKLPATINTTKILLLKDEEEGKRKLNYRSSFNYVNIAELALTKEHAKFIFISFFVEKFTGSVNWWPKHNCILNFDYDTQSKTFVLTKQKFDYVYSNKYTKK